ncbi:MAG: DUF349 domain-containing protein [Nocardioidaceae bacterium]|nr:DUF349 domain-containing protein [Nocardioidaceae bacterium]
MTEQNADPAVEQPVAAAPPRPGPPPPRPGPSPAAIAPGVPPPTTPPDTHGRVDDAGNVYVTTAAGERLVGQWPEGDREAALAFYRTRYEGLVVEVDLLERRIVSGSLSPDEATTTTRKLRESVLSAQAVGDLDALAARLDALEPLIARRREKRKAERAAKAARSKTAKEAIAAQAEQVAQGSDWRQGANRMRELLDEWKVLPRIDKQTDDELWHRFSSARTTYTRRRKQHFAEVHERRDTARAVKEKLVVDAEALATSTDWGATARAYRELMQQWKAAGGAERDVDDALWKRFSGAQDTFFGARDSENSKLDEEYTANAEVKRQLLVEAEKLAPVRDAKQARETFRSLADRWDAAGKVPRDQLADLEARFKRIEQAVRGAEDDRWRRSNPEGHARAADTVAQLEATISSLRADLEKAEAAGNSKKADDARSAIEARQAWLGQARSALSEFSG